MFVNVYMKPETEKMYFLNKFCCICMNKSDLKHMFDVDNDGVSHYNKLTSSIAEMHFKEMNNRRLICGECCVTLNTVYNFRQTCLRSKTNLINYISQLQTYSPVSGTLSVRLKEVVHDIMVVQKEIEIKCENEVFVKENNQQHEFQTENDEDSIHCLASVKEECESEEEDSSAHEDATADHVNEGDVKVEDVELQTMMEDEAYIEYSEIDMQDPLIELKEEPMSDTETSQDGHTSQADAGTSEEPKESEETNVGTKHTLNNIFKESYTCEICRKSFDLEAYLISHLKEHASEGPYKCEICKKGFPLKRNLRDHMKIHSGERPFECEICKKRFPLKRNLLIHMKLHTDERTYECEICKKTFSGKNNLNQHLKTHSGEAPYECEICKKCFLLKKSFTRKNNLAQHMRIHSGERPYECEICHKNFIRKGHLTKHLESHCKTFTSFECEICQRSFLRERYFEAHIKTHSAQIRHEYGLYLSDDDEFSMKEVSMSGTETPQNGSTSQADARTSEKPKESEETVCKKVLP